MFCKGPALRGGPEDAGEQLGPRAETARSRTIRLGSTGRGRGSTRGLHSTGPLVIAARDRTFGARWRDCRRARGSCQHVTPLRKGCQMPQYMEIALRYLTATIRPPEH